MTVSMELRVWPNCLDVHAIGDEALPIHFEVDDRSTANRVGYAALGFCWRSGAREGVEMPSGCCPQLGGLSQDAFWTQGWVKAAVVSDPQAPALPHCGLELTRMWLLGLRSTSGRLRRPMIVDTEGHAALPVWGDGHAWRILLTGKQRFQLLLENPEESATDVRLIFHLDEPPKITGVASLLLNLTGRPSGVHLQLSTRT